MALPSFNEHGDLSAVVGWHLRKSYRVLFVRALIPKRFKLTLRRARTEFPYSSERLSSAHDFTAKNIEKLI
jgi:hypothetical protein